MTYYRTETCLDEVVPTMSSILEKVQQDTCSQLKEREVVATQQEALIKKTRPIGLLYQASAGK
jgi:hypothetical protein